MSLRKPITCLPARSIAKNRCTLVKAYEDLGISDYPRVIRAGLSESQKREHARRMNLARRHLSQAQKRELIRQQLQETPERSDQQIARLLGVTHPTVGALRRELTGAVVNLTTPDFSEWIPQQGQCLQTMFPRVGGGAVVGVIAPLPESPGYYSVAAYHITAKDWYVEGLKRGIAVRGIPLVLEKLSLPVARDRWHDMPTDPLWEDEPRQLRLAGQPFHSTLQH